MGSRVAYGDGHHFYVSLVDVEVGLGWVPVLGRTRGGLYQWMGGTFWGRSRKRSLVGSSVLADEEEELAKSSRRPASRISSSIGGCL